MTACTLLDSLIDSQEPFGSNTTHTMKPSLLALGERRHMSYTITMYVHVMTNSFRLDACIGVFEVTQTSRVLSDCKSYPESIVEYLLLLFLVSTCCFFSWSLDLCGDYGGLFPICDADSTEDALLQRVLLNLD